MQNSMYGRCVDSATLLVDLDALATPEWQTLTGTGNEEKEAELTARAYAAATGAAAYSIAQQALWHNCPDALEAALALVRKELELMDQKLRFTRIRQHFVHLCQAFHMGGKSASIHKFIACAEALGKECVALIECQVAEQSHALPGLITRRDSILLHQRMQDIVKRVTDTRLTGSTLSGRSAGSNGTPSRRRERASSNSSKGVCRGSMANDVMQTRCNPGGRSPSPTVEQPHQQSPAVVMHPPRGLRHGYASESGDSVPKAIRRQSIATTAGECELGDVTNCEAAEPDEPSVLQVDISRFFGVHRSDLIDALFHLLDVDGDSRLKWHELRTFMSRLMQSEQFLSSKVYLQVCSELSVAPHVGLDLKAFAALVDERVECGCHCTNVELAAFLALTEDDHGMHPDAVHAKSGGA